VQSATAAPRDWTPQITNGTTAMALGPAVSVASGATAQIYPVKPADGVAYAPPEMPLCNAYYLDVLDTMAAAETATLWAWYSHRSNEYQ